MGPQVTEIVLELKRDGQDTFEVTLLRTVAKTAAAGKDQPQAVSDGTEKRGDCKKNTLLYN
jgi:hypothetical protein